RSSRQRTPSVCPTTLMMPSPDNLAIIAAAGSRKTEHIVDSALAVKDEPVLITTYTLENQRQILNRIHDKVGPMPSNLTVLGWFSFLIAQGARPYQRALTGSPGTMRKRARPLATTRVKAVMMNRARAAAATTRYSSAPASRPTVASALKAA